MKEGDAVNVNITNPGATLALGLMFHKTGNKAVSEWMKPPETQLMLDFIRPDFLLLRTLARGLILWEEVSIQENSCKNGLKISKSTRGGQSFFLAN